MVTIEATPASLEVDPGRAAVLVVDMQNDFGAPGGMFERAGIDISGIGAAAEASRSVLEAARAADIPVVYLKMEHAPDLSDVGPEDGPHWIKHSRLRVGDEVVAPDGSPSRILIRDTWNTQILDSLAPEPGDLVVSKHRYSGFFETDLDDVLRGLGANYLFVTGCTYDVENEYDSWRVYVHQYRDIAGRKEKGGLQHTYLILDAVGNCLAHIPGTEFGALN